MNKNEIKKLIKELDTSIDKIDKKQNKLLFFVADSKGTPIGSLTYVYDIALKMQDMGYHVEMLYAEKEFIGVEAWLGEKYAKLTHHNVSKDIIDVSPSDILFIPELYSSVMSKTKDLKCKKVAILQNFGYMTDLIPFGVSWMSQGISDCITTSNSLKTRLNEVFPQIKTRVIRPSIPQIFKPNDDQKFIVNIVANSETDINNIVKPFKWRYPAYGFVTFRFLSKSGTVPTDEEREQGITAMDKFAQYLSEGTITVWVDEMTDFGYSALEAMACGSIVIGKMPENEPDWMLTADGQLKDNGIWFLKMRELPIILADVINAVLHNEIPTLLYDNMKETVEYFCDENQHSEIEHVIVEDIIKSKRDELVVIRDAIKNNQEKEESK